jgi:hypothetical protein
MRGLVAAAVAGLAFFAVSAGAFAQEDLEKGKSGAQIFATDCAICHKTPQAVLKGGAPGEGFLRQHYTSSRETAAAVAAYLAGLKAPARAERASKPKSAVKPGGKGEPKAAVEKSNAGKEAKPAEAKPAAAENKSTEKPLDAKVGEPKAPAKKQNPAEKKE